MATRNESGDASGSPGKSSLFFLTAAADPGIDLLGERVAWLAKHLNL